MPHHKFTLPEGLCICRDVTCKIPYGECHCGCGKKTAISKQSSTKLGNINGMPKQWINGHFGAEKRVDFSDAKPFKIDGVYCLLIQLTKGYWTIVDKNNYKRLSRWRWRAVNSCDGHYYAGRTEQGRKNGEAHNISMSRVICGLSRKNPREADHINRNTLDNRIANLRVVSHRQNRLNSKTRKDCKSGLKGVGEFKKTGKFVARITVHGKLKSLGYFDTPEAAHAAYCNASHIYHGEYGRTE